MHMMAAKSTFHVKIELVVYDIVSILHLPVDLKNDLTILIPTKNKFWLSISCSWETTLTIPILHLLYIVLPMLSSSSPMQINPKHFPYALYTDMVLLPLQKQIERKS